MLTWLCHNDVATLLSLHDQSRILIMLSQSSCYYTIGHSFNQTICYYNSNNCCGHYSALFTLLHTFLWVLLQVIIKRVIHEQAYTYNQIFSVTTAWVIINLNMTDIVIYLYSKLVWRKFYSVCSPISHLDAGKSMCMFLIH